MRSDEPYRSFYYCSACLRAAACSCVCKFNDEFIDFLLCVCVCLCDSVDDDDGNVGAAAFDDCYFSLLLYCVEREKKTPKRKCAVQERVRFVSFIYLFLCFVYK